MNKIYWRVLRSLASTGLLAYACAGCAPKALPPAATVDGAAISAQSIASVTPAGDEKRRQHQLETSISEQLLANAARADKLDAQDDVRAALEVAQRSVLARVYAKKLEAALPAPSDAEVQQFYAEHPELFSKRRVYRLQEIAVAASGSQINAIQSQFLTLQTFGKRAEWLKKEGIPFTVGASVKAAEDLPNDLAATMLRMSDGTTFNLPSPSGFTTVQITAVEEMPRTFEQAQANIRRFLHNQQLGKAINAETERLRKAAKIQYFAPYADKVATGAK